MTEKEVAEAIDTLGHGLRDTDGPLGLSLKRAVERIIIDYKLDGSLRPFTDFEVICGTVCSGARSGGCGCMGTALIHWQKKPKWSERDG